MERNVFSKQRDFHKLLTQYSLCYDAFAAENDHIVAKFLSLLPL